MDSTATKLFTSQRMLKRICEEHEEGVMSHASFNRSALQRMLETGMADERPTYGLEYCAMTSVDLHGVMLRAAMEEAERS